MRALGMSCTLSFLAAVSAALSACDRTGTCSVVLDNRYAPSPSALVIFDAKWQAVQFPAPVVPGASSDSQPTIAASENVAYVVLAPGWDPSGDAGAPTSLIVMQSKIGYGVHFYETLHIPVDGTTFDGNCAAGSHLTQAQADVITQLVFPSDFASFTYDAATCTITPIGDAGAD